MRWTRRGLLAGAALALPMAAAGPAAQEDTVLNVIPHADLKNLDPIWTTAYITRNHGYLIYDTLFAMDENFEPQPQMVEDWEVSEDRKTWTFTLRDGLTFHDGEPVTSEDVIASLERWGARDGMGQQLMARDGEHDRRRRQDLRVPAEEALRAGTAVDRQDQLERALHHAEAGRRDRPVRADQRLHRLRPLRVRRPTSGCRARPSSTTSSRTTCRATSRPRPRPAARSPRSTRWSGPTSPTSRRR